MNLTDKLKGAGFGTVPRWMRTKLTLTNPLADRADVDPAKVRALVSEWSARPNAEGWICVTDRVDFARPLNDDEWVLSAEIADGDRTLSVHHVGDRWHAVVAHEGEDEGDAFECEQRSFVGVKPGAAGEGIRVKYRIYWPTRADVGGEDVPQQIGARCARFIGFENEKGA